MRTRIDGVPLLGVVAASGSGKTTLLRALLPRLKSAGLRVGCIKHTHHVIDIDRPGKDSHRLRAAGAHQMLLAAPNGWALMVDTPPSSNDDFTTLVRRLDLRSLDLVLVEGYTFEDLPKLALHRYDLSGALLAPNDGTVIAIASNQEPLPCADVPIFALNDSARIANFIIHQCAQLQGLRDVDHRT